MKKIITLIFIAWLSQLSLLNAQDCLDCGFETDGAFHAVNDTTINAGDYQFKSFVIDARVTVNVVGTIPLHIRCTGHIHINGKITVSGKNGEDASMLLSGGQGGSSVAGGFQGGDGINTSQQSSAGNNGQGPGNGMGGVLHEGGGGAGYALKGIGNLGGNVYGTADLAVLTGGSGGGSGSIGRPGSFSGGGGAGGGIIIFEGCKNIYIGKRGCIESKGGNGGSSAIDENGAGGGGSGGTIWLKAQNLINNGIISAEGGSAGIYTGKNTGMMPAGDGSYGRIRLDCIKIFNENTIFPETGFIKLPFVANVHQSSSVDCYGDANGFARVRVIGGQQPYQYRWSDGSVSSEIKKLPTGIYTVTVSDAQGCKLEKEITINEPTPVQPSWYVIPTSCNHTSEGLILAGATGGSPYPISKKLLVSMFSNDESNGIMFESSVSFPITLEKFFILNTGGGTDDTVSIWYKQGGISSYEFDSTQWISLGIYTTDNFTPDNYSVINIANPVDLVEGSYSFYILNKTGNIFLLSSSAMGNSQYNDKYLAISNGISRSLSANGDFSGVILNQNRFMCGGIGYSVKNSNNNLYDFTWNNQTTNSRLITHKKAGDYTLKIRDAAGCISQKKISITNQDIPELDTIVNTPPTCFGGTNGKSKLYIQHSDSIKRVGNISDNIYTGKQIIFSFETADTIILKSFDLFIQDTVALSIYFKSGDYSGHENNINDWTSLDSITANPSARLLPVTFSLSNRISFAPGKYSICLFCRKGSIISTSQAVRDSLIASGKTVNIYSGIALDGANTPFSGTIIQTLSLNGSINYYTKPGEINVQWPDGTVSLENNHLSKGTFQVTISEGNACGETHTVQIDEPSEIQSHFSIVNDKDSSGVGAVFSQVSGGTPPYYFYWPSNSSYESDLKNIKAGTYHVLVTDNYGCPHYDTVVVQNEKSIPPDYFDLTLVPNPSSGFVKPVHAIKNMHDCLLKVIDQTGRTVRQENITLDDLLSEGLNLSDLCDGIYTVLISDSASRALSRIIISR